jgi:hypothetical protein
MTDFSERLLLKDFCLLTYTMTQVDTLHNNSGTQNTSSLRYSQCTITQINTLHNHSGTHNTQSLWYTQYTITQVHKYTITLLHTIHIHSGTHNTQTKMHTDLLLNCYTFHFKHNCNGWMKMGKSGHCQVSWEYFLWWQIILCVRTGRQRFLMGTARGCEQH